MLLAICDSNWIWLAHFISLRRGPDQLTISYYIQNLIGSLYITPKRTWSADYFLLHTKSDRLTLHQSEEDLISWLFLTPYCIWLAHFTSLRTEPDRLAVCQSKLDLIGWLFCVCYSNLDLFSWQYVIPKDLTGENVTPETVSVQMIICRSKEDLTQLATFHSKLNYMLPYSVLMQTDARGQGFYCASQQQAFFVIWF
jgi:hypothetical protein